MHLKQLTIQGFKSFADRTTFTFDRAGLTCIVGPNGCGKSNVFEAVKWILGEQRPTSLRSRELTDVIFNGTVRRPPMGLCEGVLVFDNSCGTLPTPDAEVRVARRVFRSGESDYQINGRSCRLKDVRDLFAGTGLGAGGYGFMEQGKIDSILASNPLDRRKVFEEAAGISRFRARRRETELKLDRVVENLTRLHDIVEEIERQIRSLKLHAGKARSHREMTARVKDLQARFSIRKFRALMEETAALDAELAKVDGEREEAARRHQERREALKAIDGELRDLLGGISEIKTRYAEVQERINGCRDRMEFQARYASEVEERRVVREAEMRTLSERIESLELEGEAAGAEREALLDEQARVEGLLVHHGDLARAAKADAESLKDRRGEAVAYLKDLERREAELDRALARLQSDIAHTEERIASTSALAEAAASELAEIGGRLDAEMRTQGERHGDLESAREALRDAEARSEAIEKSFLAATEDLRARELSLGRMQTRRDVLGAVLAKGEGLDSGVVALLGERKRNPEFLAGFRGLLHELIRVDVDCAQSVQIALDELAGAVVVDSTADALEALDWLRARKAGRAVFIPLDRFAGGQAVLPDAVRHCAPGAEAAVAALLERVQVAGAEEFVKALHASAASLKPLVICEDGAALRDGSVIYAPATGDRRQGLFVIQAEIQDLDRRIGDVRTEEESARSRVAALRAQRDEVREAMRRLRSELLDKEGESARLDQVAVRLLADRERIERDLDRHREALTKLRGEGEGQREGLAETVLSRDALAGDLQAAEARLAELDDRLREAQERREAADQEFSQASICAAQTGERLSGIASRIQQIASLVEESRSRLASSGRDVADWSRARAEALAAVDQAETELKGLRTGGEALAGRIGQSEQVADAVRERLRETAEQASEIEQELERLRDAVGRLRGREGELKAAAEGLLERAKEELDLDLTDRDALSAFPEEEADPAELRDMEREIRELKERIIRLGNVNLAAVEELEAAEARASFILRERDDLIESRDQLKRILKTIEEQSVELFSKTFAAVGEHFSTIFRRLFGGGKAEVLLENPESPLESGIEIKARPPGKELRSITLLSGGERTMTAVALLFAIFRANPAPCAFLDEVDAALDEDNTDRFCRMLLEFNEQSQFVVVTHSKRTMERADLLYGVTMPERGVSRRVAVRLEQMDEQGRFLDLGEVNRQAAAAAAEEEAGEASSSRVAEPDGGTRGGLRAPLEAAAIARRVRDKGGAGPKSVEAETSSPG